MCSAPLEFIYIPTTSVAKAKDDHGDCEVMSQSERITTELEQPTLSQSCRWSSEPKLAPPSQPRRKGRKRTTKTVGSRLSRAVASPGMQAAKSQYDPQKQRNRVFYTKSMPPKRPQRTQSIHSMDAKSLDAAVARRTQSIHTSMDAKSLDAAVAA